MKIPITCAQNQEELFDVMPTPQFDRSDNVLYNPPKYLFEANNAEKTKFAVIKRKDAHKTGAWHRAIGIWLYNDHGEVLLQRRSAEKDSYPLRWQSSAAGHVTSGDTVEETVIKEVEEEVGIELSVSDLELVAVTCESEQGQAKNFGQMIDNEYRFIYIAFTSQKIDEFNFNTHEVCELKFVPYRQALAAIDNQDPSVCPASKNSIACVRAALAKKGI